MLAYGLILLMVLVAIGAALYIRHNSRPVRLARERKRDLARYAAKLPE